MDTKRPQAIEAQSNARDTTRKRFAAWVRSVGGSREAAALLGVSRSYVDMIRSGDRSPGMRTAHRIERLTGAQIPMQAWVR